MQMALFWHQTYQQNQLASTSAPLDFSITLPNIAPRPTIKATLPQGATHTTN